jgi:hypothetical protein
VGTGEATLHPLGILCSRRSLAGAAMAEMQHARRTKKVFILIISEVVIDGSLGRVQIVWESIEGRDRDKVSSSVCL